MLYITSVQLSKAADCLRVASNKACNDSGFWTSPALLCTVTEQHQH
jgi:hypothetical protein